MLRSGGHSPRKVVKDRVGDPIPRNVRAASNSGEEYFSSLKGTKINIDYAGHSDSGGEVERILRMVDGATRGEAFAAMPQTRSCCASVGAWPHAYRVIKTTVRFDPIKVMTSCDIRRVERDEAHSTRVVYAYAEKARDEDLATKPGGLLPEPVRPTAALWGAPAVSDRSSHLCR